MAVTSLVLGLLSFFCWIFTGLPAIILGIIALGQIDRSQGRLTGKGMAIAGITTGSISLLMIIPMMVALLLPAVQAAREAARRNVATNNMKVILIALQNYHDTRKAFPPAAAVEGEGAGLSWRVHILPFLDDDSNRLYEQFHLDEPWDSPHNLELAQQMPEVFKDPSGKIAPGKTSYLAVVGPGTAFGDGTKRLSLLTFRDGTSNTVMVVEADPEEAVEWTKPADWQYDPNDPTRGLGNLRPNGFMAGFADAHIEFIENGTPAEEIHAIMTRAGGEPRQDGPGF
jgi:hypothetical protein